jgi:hypothetical protein
MKIEKTLMIHNYLKLIVLLFVTCTFASPSDNKRPELILESSAQQKAPKVYGQMDVQENKKTLLIWEGDLTLGSKWAVYSGSCNGVLLGTTSKNSFLVTPSRSQATFYVQELVAQYATSSCGSFEFKFDSAAPLSISYSKDSFSNQDENPLPQLNSSISGIYLSLDNSLILDTQTGEIDLARTASGSYQIMFLPTDASLGYSLTTLDVLNVGTLSISTTTQAAEDLTDGLFTVTASAAPASNVRVTISVSGSATGGTDYVTIPTTFIFPAGQTTFDLPVDVIPDSSLEGTETIVVTLQSTDSADISVGATSFASMNLSDNDSASVNIADATGNEDDGAITITATLSNAVQGGFSVDLSTIDASATVADNDYTAITSQTLLFNGTSGEVQTITLLPTPDATLENDETIIISMSNLSGTALPVNITNSAIVTILNDEVDCTSANVAANFQTFDSGCSGGGNSGAATAVLFYDGFENADTAVLEYRDSVDPIPGLPQWRYEGAPSVSARLSVFNTGVANRANNGSKALGLDAGNNVPHSIILNLDLSQEIGADDLRFSYAYYNSGDENAAADVVSIRGDVTDPWVTLSDWNVGIRNQWTVVEEDIDAVLTAAGQSVSANTEIRFTQSDNFQFNTDGVIFDDVTIFKEGYTYLWNNNETTGVVQDLAPGNYSVVVTTPDGCSVTLSGAVGGIPADDSSFTYASSTLCQSDANVVPTITGLAGGFFTSSPFGLSIDQLTGEIDPINSISGRTYLVTYQTNGSCPSNSDFTITVDFAEDSSFAYNSNTFTLADTTQFPLFVGTFGGTFSSTPAGLDLDSVTGEIEPAISTVGSYTVSYMTLGNCPSTTTQQINILNADIVAPVARCQPFVGQLDADGNLTIQAFNVDAGSTDDVSIASLQVSQTSFSCEDVGVNNVVLTVTDTSGNTDTCTTTVTVEDTDAPVLQCADITLELDANGDASLNNGSFASTTDYSVTSTSLNMESLPNENLLALGDDQITANLPVGFDFDYFGNTYATFRISSNGFIGFGGLANNGCCQGGDLTSGSTFPANIIALAWTDLNPSGPASIGYETIGTAPNRKLVVNFSNTPAFGGAGNITGQIHLFEGSGRIEIHTVSNNITRNQTQGILNADSSVGFPVPGRNAGVWNATNDAWAFEPANIFATDNCTLTDVTVSKLDFTCADIGVNSVSISATDASGNVSNCSFFVTVVDNDSPVPTLATLPDVITDCQVTSLTPPAVTDNCASSVNIINNASLPITNQGTTVITWFYSDGNGNFSFQNQNIVINDVTPPVPDVTNLPDVLATCDVTTLTPPTATEASCANGDVTVTGISNASLPITSSGTTVVTWTYTDANGNFATQDQNIVINDNIAPVGDVANLPDLADQCEINSLTAPTATDNCSPTVTVTNNAVLPIVTSSTIVWSYEDADGNIATQNQQVIISDTIAPTADVATLADINSDCEVTSLTAPTATDNCSAVVTVTADVSLPITVQGTTVITWTYTDGNGNASTQTQNVIITDSIAPVADLASLTDVTADCEVTALTAPTATDNCSGVITAVSNISLPITTQGTTVVTWTFDDGNGNTSTQNQNVIIADTLAPVPNIATLSPLVSECAITSIGSLVANDNCSGVVFATNDAVLPITSGTTTVTYTFDDGNGNITTQTQQITVNDTTAPTPDVTNLPDLVEQCQVTALVPPTATDNCAAVVTVTNNATLPLTAASTVVIWTYDDGNGNTVTQTQNVLINDTTGPAPDLTVLPDVLGQCEVTALVPPTATDNCAAAISVTNDASLPITAASTMVTWTYDDGNGNITTQTQNVLVNDDTAPTATCPLDVVVAVSTSDYAVLDYTTGLMAADNCSDSSALIITQSIAPGTLVSVPSTNAITVTITDENGNDQVCTFQLRVDQDLSNGDIALENLNITIYPNPTNGKLNIGSDVETMESIELIDFRGRLVKTWNLNSINETQIDISEFESAIYFLRIRTENNVINKRVVKN